jgi:hypothetical protein
MFQWYPPGAISRAFREVETPKHYLNPIGRIGRLENGVGAEEILSGITCVGTRGIDTKCVDCGKQAGFISLFYRLDSLQGNLVVLRVLGKKIKVILAAYPAIHSSYPRTFLESCLCRVIWLY